MFYGLAIILFVIILIASRFKVPFVVIALVAGIIFGKDILNLISFDNFVLAKKIADYALVFVLFIAGFCTQKEKLKLVLAPALTLATGGVILTAGVVAVCLNLFLNIDILTSILIGCIIASTDAAACFSVLKGKKINPKISSLVEVESATNDPMGIILTTIMVAVIASIDSVSLWHGKVIGDLIWKLIGGSGIGIAVGYLLVFMSKFVSKLEIEYYYAYLIASIMISFSIADIVNASGILSAFFAGFVLGNSKIPHEEKSSNLLEALSSIGNLVIFITLGLLASPIKMYEYLVPGLVLFLVLTFLARPISVFIGMIFTKNKVNEKLFVAWSGLRGAVPILLATYPAAADIEFAEQIFNMVFVAVLMSLLVQGLTIGKIAEKLKLS